jgi:CRISPR-associated protein Cas2
MAMTVVIADDISEDQRRARAAATLEQRGDRVQRPVFVCVLDAGQLAEMIAPATDSAYAFQRCAACWERAWSGGYRGRAVLTGRSFNWLKSG